MVLEVVMRSKGVKMLGKKKSKKEYNWMKRKMFEELLKCVEESEEDWDVERVIKDVERYEKYNGLVCDW